MTYRLLISQRAAADLEEAYRWYAERSPEGAVRWYNGFLDALDTLAADPERCPLAPEDSRFPIEVRQLLYGRRRSYRALFRFARMRSLSCTSATPPAASCAPTNWNESCNLRRKPCLGLRVRATVPPASATSFNSVIGPTVSVASRSPRAGRRGRWRAGRPR